MTAISLRVPALRVRIQGTAHSRTSPEPVEGRVRKS